MPNMPTGNMQGGGGTGLMGGLSDFFGTSNKYQATPYEMNQADFGLVGGPSGDQMEAGRTGYGANAAADRGNQLGARDQQQAYLQQLQQTAAGNGPSQAAGIMQQAGNQAAANSMSLARSMNNGNPAQQAAAMRAAQAAGSSAISGGGAAAAQVKAQEQNQALGAMGGALSGMRGQDLQSQGLGQNMEGAYLGAGNQAAQAQLNANVQHAQLASQNYNEAQGLNAGIAGDNAKANSAMLAGVSGAAEGALGAMGMSDARVKTDIQPEGEEESGGNGRKGDFGGIFGGFAAGLNGKPTQSKKPESKKPKPPMTGIYDRPPGYDAMLGQRMIDERAGDQRPPMHPPPMSLDEAMAQSAGQPGVPPAPQGQPMGEPGWGTFGGAPQGPQQFPYPPSGVPGGLAVNMPPPSAPPPYVPSDIRGKEQMNMAGGGLPPGAMPIAQVISSDARAKEDAFAAGVRHGQEANGVLHDPTRPSHPLFNSYYPTGEYVGPAGSGFAAFQDRGDKLVKEKVMNLSDRAPVKTVIPIAPPRDVLMPPEHRPPVAVQRQAIEDAMRAQPQEPETIELDEPQQAMIELDRPPQGGAPTVYSDERLKTERMKANAITKRASPYGALAPDLAGVTYGDSAGDRWYQKTDDSVMHGNDTGKPDTAQYRAVDDGKKIVKAKHLETLTGAGKESPDYVVSDENMKGGISRTHPSEGTKSGQRMTEADHFLEHLRPYTYRYKDPSNEPSSQPTGGRYLGVMAQDVERAPGIGQQIVKDTPRGKVLEGGALMSALAGGVGRLHERMSALEKRGG